MKDKSSVLARNPLAIEEYLVPICKACKSTIKPKVTLIVENDVFKLHDIEHIEFTCKCGRVYGMVGTPTAWKMGGGDWRENGTIKLVKESDLP